MKKQLMAFLLLLTILLTVVSCGEHIPAINPIDTNVPVDTDATDAPTYEGDGTTTVNIVLTGGLPYVSDTMTSDENALKVRFTGSNGVHTVNVGADGTATIANLDGSYSVTLINVPEGYTYNPNIYSVNNEKREIDIELLTINEPSDGNGKNEYQHSFVVKKTGVYRATVKDGSTVVYYRFKPTQAGRYCFESMMDTTAEMYNPKAEIYNGNYPGAWFYQYTLDDGGPSGSYTKNFRHIIEIDEKFLGNSWLIGIKVEGKDAAYPVDVDFSITYLGGYHDGNDVTSTMVLPTFIPSSNSGGQRDDTAFNEWKAELDAYLAADKALYGSANYTDAAVRVGNVYLFDESNYKLNPDDGFYHLYDEELYASTNGYGPILYADITVDYKFSAGSDYPSAFSLVEYNGSNALTLCEGTLNYKLFIEGYDTLSVMQSGQSGAYLCNSNCPCYQAFINGYSNNNGGMCTTEDNCTDCKSGCRHLSSEFKYQYGYAQIVNSDGRAPVTEELKIFLQRYSEGHYLFADGYGYVETYTPTYTAYESSQWLFACGYYYG